MVDMRRPGAPEWISKLQKSLTRKKIVTIFLGIFEIRQNFAEIGRFEFGFFFA